MWKVFNRHLDRSSILDNGYVVTIEVIVSIGLGIFACEAPFAYGWWSLLITPAAGFASVMILWYVWLELTVENEQPK